MANVANTIPMALFLTISRLITFFQCEERKCYCCYASYEFSCNVAHFSFWHFKFLLDNKRIWKTSLRIQ